MLLALFIVVQMTPGQSARTVVKPTDTGAPLINPGMGWMFHHYDNNITRYTVDLEPSDGVDEFPGVSSVYIRLAWSYLEPEEGQVQLGDCGHADAEVDLERQDDRFPDHTSEGSASQGFATPRWVEKAGREGPYY